MNSINRSWDMTMIDFNECQEIVAGSKWKLIYDRQGCLYAIEVGGEQTILNKREPVERQTWQAISRYVERRRAESNHTGGAHENTDSPRSTRRAV